MSIGGTERDRAEVGAYNSRSGCVLALVYIGAVIAGAVLGAIEGWWA